MRTALNLTIILCLLLQTALPALAGTLEDAKDAYDNKKFGECLAKCQVVLRGDSKNEKAHYYQALAYQGSGQMAPAKSEYLWVYNNGKDYNLKKNAWVALQGLGKYSAHRAVESRSISPPAANSSSSTVGSTAQATPPPRKERRITEEEAITIQEEKEREAAEAAGITYGVRRSCGRRCH